MAKRALNFKRRSAAVLALLLLGLLCGCKSIRSVHLAPDQPLALTATEADQFHQEGLALYHQQPRMLVRVTNAARLLAQAAQARGNDYEVQWQAAMALAFLAQYEPRTEFRLQAARQGVALARRARELKPESVEGHYWYALNVGLLADADRSYGLDAVAEMETALKRAVDLDERHDFAGPLRVFGILYLRTPAPPASIGSPRKGLRLLQRAADLFPDYPENQLYLAEALRDNGRQPEAETALHRVLDAAPWPDCQFESGRWKTEAQKLLDGLTKP